MNNEPIELDAINQKIRQEVNKKKKDLYSTFMKMFETSRRRPFTNSNKDLQASVNFLLDFMTIQTLEIIALRNEINALRKPAIMELNK